MIKRKVIVGPKVLKLIDKLGKKMNKLPQPIHLLAVCTGGIPLTLELKKYFDREGIKSEIYRVWTDTVNEKCYLRETDFKKNKYIGSAVIVEDVVWRGHHLPPIKSMLRKINPKKKFYVAALFDCGKLCDFSVYP